MSASSESSGSTPVTIPSTTYPVERFTLHNGLRVVLTPDRSAPVIGVAVVYDVGIRSEPEGRTGFAHLFEHLMFMGTRNVPNGGFDTLMEQVGGSNNASTTSPPTTRHNNTVTAIGTKRTDGSDGPLDRKRGTRRNLPVLPWGGNRGGDLA